MATPRILVLDRAGAAAGWEFDPVATLSGAFPDHEVHAAPESADDDAGVACVVAVGPLDDDAARFVRETDAPVVYLGGDPDERVPAGVLAAGVAEARFLANAEDPAAALVDAVEGTIASGRMPDDAPPVDELQRRYRRLLGQDLFGVYIIQDGQIRFVNRRGARIFGYEPEELIDEMSAFDVVAEEDHERLAENIRKRERGDHSEMRYQLTGVRKDGSRLEFEVHSGVIEYEGDPALLGVIVDVTERKRRRQRLQVLNRVLRHNLRNDLNVVVGRMEDAIHRLRDHGDDRGANVVAQGLEEARDLVATSEKLRRIQETIERDLNEDPVLDAVDAIERVVEFVREKYPEATVRTDLPEEARVQADRAFDIAVENLVVNAIEHNDGDPTVEVSLSESDRDRGQWYELRVADDGPGIPEQEQVVVDEDAEVTPLRHSSGVGLWTVAWVVQSFDGSIDIETDGVEGSVVTVALQAAE